MEGQFCDDVKLSSNHVLHRSPSPSHENGTHAFWWPWASTVLLHLITVFGQNSFLILWCSLCGRLIVWWGPFLSFASILSHTCKGRWKSDLLESYIVYFSLVFDIQNFHLPCSGLSSSPTTIDHSPGILDDSRGPSHPVLLVSFVNVSMTKTFSWDIVVSPVPNPQLEDQTNPECVLQSDVA